MLLEVLGCIVLSTASMSGMSVANIPLCLMLYVVRSLVRRTSRSV